MVRKDFEPPELNAPRGMSRVVSNEAGEPEKQPPASDPAEFARTAVWLLRTQALLVVIGAIVGVVVADVGTALALLAGGGIGIVLTAVSALRAGSVAGSAAPARIAAAFYRGMMLKMVFAVVLFVLVATMYADWFLPILIGYVATLVAFWIALLRLGRQAGSGNALNNE